MLKRNLMAGVALPLFNAEGGSGGGTGATIVTSGDQGGAGGSTPSPETILFPNEEKSGSGTAGEGDKKEGEGGEKKDGGDSATDWKEYENDPAKTPEENAAAKADHDKTKPKEGDDGKGKPDPLDTVPEDGKYNLNMPEGVTVDQELLDALAPQFKAKGMTTREAQALADDFIKVQQQQAEKRMDGYAKTISGWADAAKKDPDIGGDKWDTTVANSQKAVKALGTPGLREYLNASGGGNHPELIRMFAKVGEMIREDTPADSGAGGSGKPVEAAYVLFPNDKPKGN